MRVCVYCNKEIIKKDIANHTRWCIKNPKRNEYILTLRNNKHPKHPKHPKTGKKGANQYTYGAKMSEETRERIGKASKGRLHSDNTKTKMSISARKSKHRRLVRHRIKYKGIWLDSRWELLLAQKLDELSIIWERPDPLIWFDSENKNHNYFPDFYLPQYDLFLDPKNEFAKRSQKKKLEIISKTYKNVVIMNYDDIDNFETFISFFKLSKPL